MKHLPNIRNNHDTVVDWRDYVDNLPVGQFAEMTVEAFSDGDTLMECLQYAALSNVPVLFIPLQTEEDYNPHNDPSTYGL